MQKCVEANSSLQGDVHIAVCLVVPSCVSTERVGSGEGEAAGRNDVSTYI
jgi:hypothetical protein